MADMVADKELDIVADMEVDKVADMMVDMVADMVADMEVEKVAKMLTYIWEFSVMGIFLFTSRHIANATLC